jgi:hypothetical protein
MTYIHYKDKILHIYFTYFVTRNLYLEAGQFKRELVVIMTKVTVKIVYTACIQKRAATKGSM